MKTSEVERLYPILFFFFLDIFLANILQEFLIIKNMGVRGRILCECNVFLFKMKENVLKS